MSEIGYTLPAGNQSLHYVTSSSSANKASIYRLRFLISVFAGEVCVETDPLV